NTEIESGKTILSIEQVDENQLIFTLPGDKATPPIIHTVTYLETEKSLTLKSDFKHWFFPPLVLPVFVLFFAFFIEGPGFILEHPLPIIGFVAFMLLYTMISSYLSMLASSRNLERTLAIWINAFLREKGYRIKL
ncbi:MAG: hypothetical protein AAFU60_02460, partial [Bacteroidota bacterium]